MLAPLLFEDMKSVTISNNTQQDERLYVSTDVILCRYSSRTDMFIYLAIFIKQQNRYDCLSGHICGS